MDPSDAIIPPMLGMPESEKIDPPLPAAMPDENDVPLDVWYQNGK